MNHSTIFWNAILLKFNEVLLPNKSMLLTELRFTKLQNPSQNFAQAKLMQDFSLSAFAVKLIL